MPVNFSQSALEQLGYLLAEQSKNTVFVVGAGLSVPAGLPMWNDLNDKLKKVALEHIDKNITLNLSQKDDRKKSINNENDPWIIGDLLAEYIPQEVYDRNVRDLLTPKPATRPPESYKLIWSLNPSGVVSYNLDNLAKTALNGVDDQFATSLDKSKYEKFLLLSRPFLFQPHGTLDKKKNWVLGLHNRTNLLKDDPYRNFCKNLLASRRLILAGVRPEDFVIQSILTDDFRTEITRGISHFWICPNPTDGARALARNYNIEIIEYSPTDSNHNEVVEILKHLAKFKPRSIDTEAVYDGITIKTDDLPPDTELRTYEIESIRHRLNAALKGIERNVSQEKYLEIVQNFFSQYSGSLHMAWHTNPNSSYETIWGAKVIKRLDSGAFGQVWLAEEPTDGQQIAIKILHEHVLSDKDFLEAFRRGVRAMKILSEANVSGMVKFIRAFDVPACVFMEYINGATLQQAINSSNLQSFSHALNIIEDVGRIVLRGHELNKQVLHRDLKPSNIMMRDFYNDPDQTEVLVLDFDLSWYEGAIGKSMISSALHNFIAPEQLSTRKGGYSSRHTGVDVFGIGMLLYFVSTKTLPELNAHNRKDFITQIIEKLNIAWKPIFTGTVLYIAMTIEDATYEQQEKRCGLPTLIERIKNASLCLEKKILQTPSDLANLEICSRLKKNDWVTDFTIHDLGKITLRKISVTIISHFSSDTEETKYCIEINYSTTPDAPRSSLGKYIKSKTEKANAALTKNNLFNTNITTITGGATIKATMKCRPWSSSDVEKIFNAINDATAKLLFA